MTNESITNEWAEFLAYTKEPAYAVRNKKDNGFLGRFTMDMLMENYGFARILTVIAREYLFHNMDGTPKGGDPYERTDDARRALCAWCSIPEKKNAAPRAEWQFKTDFRELHGAFHELVDANGCGWYIRHLRGIADFINANRDKVGKSTHKLADNMEKLEDAWRKKVIQFQIPIFSEGTKGDLILRFDDVIADALELGALRTESFRLTDEQEQWLAEVTPKSVPLNVTHHTGALFPHYKFVVQLFQIHPAQRQATKVRFHIRHGYYAPIAVCGFVCKVVFKQCPCYYKMVLNNITEIL